MKNLTKEIFKAIIPTMLATIFTGIYVIIDGFFIGKKLGGIGLAAINIAWPIAAFMQAIGIGLGTSCGIFITANRAKGNTDNKKIYTNTFILLIFFTILSTSVFFFREDLLLLIGADSETLPYASDYIMVISLLSVFEILGCAITPILRNFNRFKTAAFLLILASIVNFIGDFLFINVLDLKLFGAALTSVLSEGIVFIVGLIILLKHKELSFNKQLDFRTALNIFYHSLAPFVLAFSISIVLIFYNLFAKHFYSNAGVAAYTVLAYVIFIPQYISMGIADGVQPLLTYHYEKKDGLMKKVFYLTLAFLSTLMVVLTIIFAFLDKQIATIFNIHGDELKIYLESYIFFLVSFILIGLIRIYASRFYSTNETIKANIVVILEPLLTPFVLMIFSLLIGGIGIWVGYLVMQAILSIVSIVFIKIPIKSKNLYDVSV